MNCLIVPRQAYGDGRSRGQTEVATLALLSFLFFMALLAVAFVYLWRDGALEWR